MMAARFLHDPSAVLDYAWDWSDWLEAGETITARTVTPAAGIVVVGATTAASGVVTAWLSGGVASNDYDVVCRITTSMARTDERTITLRVVER